MTNNVYAYLTPIAILFILLEVGLVLLFKRKYIRFQEAIANFGTALGNQTMNVLVARCCFSCVFLLGRQFSILLAIVPQTARLKWSSIFRSVSGCALAGMVVCGARRE